jgi:hypothetical protein
MKRFRQTDYFVTENGDVFRNGKKLKPLPTNAGYLRVGIYENKIYRRYLIHRLVGELYLSNPNNLPEVAHQNHIKTDNRVDNLKWSTHSDNMKENYISGDAKPAKGEKQHLSKLTKNDVLFIRQNTNKYSMRKLAKMFNVSYGTIYPIIHNKTWKHIK